jgi:Na+/H+ antiporter NhaC
MFVSRRRRGSSRFTVWKLALLFLGAGTWLAGVMMENFQVTAAAILIIVIALVLSLVERRGPEGEGEGEG